jgi:GPI mannosyltransferase 3
VVLAACFSGKRLRPVLVAALATIVAHSLIGHKEYRFIWLAVYMLLVLAAVGSVTIVNQLCRQRGLTGRGHAGAIAALCLGWAALSLTTFNLTGGTDSFRKGSYLALTAVEAAQDPKTCGIALPSRDRTYVTYAFLPRRVELYLMPDDMNEGTLPIPRELTDAANALILTEQARAPAGYRAEGCRTWGKRRACLHVRPGGCSNPDTAKRYDYQAVMEEDDM